jgi:hypothetical protein
VDAGLDGEERILVVLMPWPLAVEFLVIFESISSTISTVGLNTILLSLLDPAQLSLLVFPAVAFLIGLSLVLNFLISRGHFQGPSITSFQLNSHVRASTSCCAFFIIRNQTTAPETRISKGIAEF